jgi:phage terminase large subunit
VLLEGPYETGKTFAALSKLHLLLCKYPNSQALMVRQYRNSILTSAVMTYENKVLLQKPGDNTPVTKYGGERPEFYRYPNGSKLLVGGLDDADKYLSSEYDFIYVNQAEEITLDSWEKLCGRATGRAGNAPYPQVMADCNPSYPYHWIVQRTQLKRFKTTHQDNPRLYDHDRNAWTEAGALTIGRLQSLTGLRYKRGYLGLWAGAEGQVYEFDDLVHLVDPFPIPDDWRRIRSIDFGYTNPFVCHWWAIDPDGRMYLYREIYMSRRTVKVHSADINRLSEGENIEVTVADHDAEDRATLEENGIITEAAQKAIKTGIGKTEERLKVAGDGKPRLFVMRGCTVEMDPVLAENYYPTSTAQEFGGYIWAPTPDGKPNKEVPLDLNNHGMDAARYAVMYAHMGGLMVY